MGSTESTLPATMEEQSAQEPTATPQQEQEHPQEQQCEHEQDVPEHMPDALQKQLQSSPITDTSTTAPSNNEPLLATSRARTTSTSENNAANAQASAEDPWWWEIENENLILDLVPNAATNTDTDAPIESENAALLSNDFNTLLKIGETVNLTLSANTNSSNGNNIDDDSNNNGVCQPTSLIANENTENSLEENTIIAVAQNTSAATSDEAASSQCRVGPIRNTHENAEEAVAAALSASTLREQSLEEFKEELRLKRLARQSAVQDLRDEITTLRQQLAAEQALTRRLRCGAVDTVDTASSETAVLDKDQVIATAVGFASTEPDADDEDPMSRGRHAIIELANAQLALQLANSENISLRAELGVIQKQVSTLKEVISCCKQMLNVKEEQCAQLKTKLQEIETSFGERELRIMSTNLRQEYERQLGNIRQLRQLYEERQRIAAAEQENLQRLISIKRDELSAEQEKTKSFEERQQTLLKEIESVNNELAALRDECNEHKFEKRALKEEMGAVNTLFSQMVMGFNGRDNLDIDRLTTMLEENRTLLNDMATKEANCSDGATLPKLLFELVEQAAVSGKCSSISRSPTPTPSYTNASVCNTDEDEDDIEVADKPSVASAAINDGDETTAAAASFGASANDAYGSNECSSNIATVIKTCKDGGAGGSRKHHRKSAGNRMKLPAAVTRAVAAAAAASTTSTTLKCHETELMGKVATTQEIIGNLPKVWKVLMELLSHHKIERVQFEENGASEDCYKSVETASGTKAELSVSKTYIKLKDLILEKKSLVKETNRLKTLNCHLEYRLNEQEKRLSAVSLELTKTWHLVGKMQRQHRQLHTQEQILRYQLQQKRRLLTELKDELEYCRRKWAAARAKNDESQEQCNDLRREFAKRKLEDANNSAESGYSDSGQASDEELLAAKAEGDVSAELDLDANVVGACSVVGAVASTSSGGAAASDSAVGRRKRLKEMFEHTRKIKRMQSTSPGRAADGATEIVLRWNSAPPTCGWQCGSGSGSDGDIEDVVDEDCVNEDVAGGVKCSGAIPKSHHRSRRDGTEGLLVRAEALDVDDPRVERVERIQRLEEQCKSLIQRVLETSDNRERLEVQLRSFQDEIAPVQYALPVNDFVNKKRIERMTRASSAPVSGTLTPREEEYTRKRSERLGRLEEESRQLMSRIKRTSDRGHYLRCSLDRLRRAPSREGSFESNTEEELSKTEDLKEKITVKRNMAESESNAKGEGDDAATKTCDKGEEQVAMNEEYTTTPMQIDNENTAAPENMNPSPLTATEEAYTARRAARLQRLEAESRQLLTRLTRNNERGNTLGTKLDALHEQFSNESPALNNQETAETPENPKTLTEPTSPTIEQRIGNIERISTNRMERLRILEEEGQELLSRLSNTSARGSEMIKRIEAREQTRESRLNAERDGEIVEEVPADTGDVSNMTDASEETVNTQISCGETPTVAPLIPTLNNVACSSIVCEELTDRVTVTTTPSQIAMQQGAISKQVKEGPMLQLNAAKRAEASRIVHAPNREAQDSSDQSKEGESLEDMVRRLRELPFPEQAPVTENKEMRAMDETAEATAPVEDQQENVDTRQADTDNQ